MINYYIFNYSFKYILLILMKNLAVDLFVGIISSNIIFYYLNRLCKYFSRISYGFYKNKNVITIK